jgi:hypothetical protein
MFSFALRWHVAAEEAISLSTSGNVTTGSLDQANIHLHHSFMQVHQHDSFFKKGMFAALAAQEFHWRRIRTRTRRHFTHRLTMEEKRKMQ